MPPGPIRALRFVHAAIRAQAALVEEKCAALTDPSQVASVAADVHFLTRAVRGHVKGEDDGYFPTLAERMPNGVDTFDWDHREEAGRLDELDHLADNCSSAADLAALQRAAIVVNEHLEVHMSKEEQILWPKTEALFSPPEQGAIVGAILAVIPPAEMPVLVPWITDIIPAEDGLAYVQTLQRVQPPERFAAAVGWIKNGVSAERWAYIAAAMPDLA